MDFDLIVIGSGAGGSVGAHQAVAMGKKVAIIEKGDIGGECPNWACVPTKALLHAAGVYETAQNTTLFGIQVKEVSFDYAKIKQWKDMVVSRTGASHGEESFKKSGIELIFGQAKFISPTQVQVGDHSYSADYFLLATGSVPFIPPITGLDTVPYLTFKQAVDLETLPKSIFILGGGPIGCEFAQVFSTFGSQVYLADNTPRLLAKEETEVGDLLGALFENRGVKLFLNCKVTKVSTSGKEKLVYYEIDGKESLVKVEEILVATGKKPVLDLDLDKAQVTTTPKGIEVDQYLQTTNKSIYAAGDIVGPFLFTHTGYYQSYLAVNNMFSQEKIVPNYEVVPRCVFTKPEVGTVGMTTQLAQEKGVKVLTGTSSIAILGRANTSNEFDGFVKVITDETKTILGAAIVAPRAGEMIHELAVALKFKAKATDLADLIHAYPTFSEAIKIACSNIE